MGMLDRLLGMAAQALDLDSTKGEARAGEPNRYTPPASAGTRNPYSPPPAASPHTRRSGAPAASRAGTDADRAAIARYDYLLQTADPHRVEEIHREAFDRLTPAQRTQVQERMNAELPPHDRPRSSSVFDLARAAGRTEAARPGRMRGLLSRTRGVGAAGVVGGAAVGMLGVVALGAVSSAVAAPLLEQAAGLGVDFDALAQGVDLEGIANGLGADELVSGAAEGVTGAAEGVIGSAGEAVTGFGETAGEWGQKLGDIGLPGLGDIFGR
ncbi:cation-transporting ATPase [uncultured Microbacterium sp.]|uniref:cation-transporting ATPase n=1 Tax=uncultured Microbacterium sp. TaxID=191216 RepID=UPI0028D8DDF1|nr:cation-transporting ATPase [uncultured Microbacterium sp.]